MDTRIHTIILSSADHSSPLPARLTQVVSTVRLKLELLLMLLDPQQINYSPDPPWNTRIPDVRRVTTSRTHGFFRWLASSNTT